MPKQPAPSPESAPFNVAGIDVGLDGGVVFLGQGGAIDLSVTPVLVAEGGGKRDYDLAGMRALLASRTIDLAVIEVAAARPGQGVTSMFNFGKGYGLWLGILCGLGIPHERVTPQAWKRVILAGTARDKSAAVAYVSRRFPDASLLPTIRSRKPHDGMADAACLAEYGRRLLLGAKS